MHCSHRTAFQQGCLHTSQFIFMNYHTLGYVLRIVIQTRVQVSTRAEIFTPRRVWREPTSEEEETNVLSEQVPISWSYQSDIKKRETLSIFHV